MSESRFGTKVIWIGVSILDSSGEATFIRLYLRHEASLRGFLRAMLANWDEVDDVAQETCLVALRKFNSFEANTDFCAWLLAIGRFEAFRYRRSRATSKMILSDDLIQMIEAEVVSIDKDHSTRREALEICLSKLPEPQRNLLKAVYVRQTSVRKIAEQTNKSIDAVYKRLQRLRRILLDCMERIIAMESTR